VFGFQRHILIVTPLPGVSHVRAPSPRRPLAQRSSTTAAVVSGDPADTVGTMEVRTVICTDGACSKNPGPGGWGWVVPTTGEAAWGCEAHSTNQRMELSAVLDALRSQEGSIEIQSDSKYVVQCFTDGWWRGWQRRGWVTAQGKPVANQDLWRPLVEIARHKDVRWTWVKGHAGHAGNEAADRLATRAASEQSTSRRAPSQQ
jgi:ribonuclease HI